MNCIQLTRDQLLEMVKDAHEACVSEHMNCPWCSGRLEYIDEWHDEWCLWPSVNKELNK